MLQGPEVTYAELSLPRGCCYSTLKPQSQAIYAKIDPSKKAARHCDASFLNMSSSSSSHSLRRPDSDGHSDMSAETPLVSSSSSDGRSSASSGCARQQHVKVAVEDLNRESSV